MQKEVISIGSRREIFWDDFLVDSELTSTKAKVCPIDNCTTVAEIDDSIISYPSICKVDDEYRMYYIGGWLEEGKHPDDETAYHFGVKVMTSPDGINWTFPKVNGRKDNVVIEKIQDNIFVYRDTNPACPKNELHPNFETSAYGYVIVDILDEDGNKLSDGQSFEVFGNNIDRCVMFEDGSGFETYSGKPVRLRFRMRDAKLYSMKFE